MSEMKSRLLTVVLLVGLVFAVFIFTSSYSYNYRLPGNNQGYEPVQPLAYSHRLHAGELGIDCLYCHFGAEKSRNAGIPSMNVCMNCHSLVSAPYVDVKAENDNADKEKRAPERILSPELRKLYISLALDENLKPIIGKQAHAIEWIRIHVLPDFVYFNHSAHVNSGVTCQKCHGEVQTMERVRQFSDLTMGWCVNCHRSTNTDGVDGKNMKAPIDCIGCHY